MNKESTSVEVLIQEETEKRLGEMEEPDYQFPPRITEVDWIAIVMIILVCAACILYCMVEDM